MMNEYDLNDLEKRMDGSVESLKSDLASVRTGRASASMLDPVIVNAYDSRMLLNQVATVSVPEPRMISVNVWDAQLAGAVEQAIRESDLGLNPVTEGSVLRIPIPDLSEERRNELTKTVGKYCEQAKIAARNVRKSGMDALKKAEKDGEMSQDEQRTEADKVEALTGRIISEMDSLAEKKTAELMEV